MKSIANLIKKKKISQMISFSDKDIFYIFGKIIQEEFGNVGVSKFSADFLKNKTLFVRSQSATWASELWTNRVRIIKKINQKIGEEVILEIKTK